MLAGFLPLCFATAALFYPPDTTTSVLNVVWATCLMTVYFASFSVYVAPYLALLPELAPEKALNVRVSTMLAVFALVGGLIAINVGGVMIQALGASTPAEKAHSTATMVAVLSGVALVLLLLPIVCIPERQLVPAQGAASHAGLFESLKNTFSDKAFIPYVIGTVLFAFGFNIVRSALIFIVTVLMHEKEDSPVTIAVFGVAAVAFPVVAVAAGRLGKRPVMIAGTLVLAVALVGFWFVDGFTSGAFFLALSGLGLSSFLALPNSMLSDVCNANALRTGERREAMFFGAQGFLLKINLGVSFFTFSFLLDQYGRSVGHDLGIRLTGPVAAVALVGAAIAYSRYPEQRIAAELAAAPAAPATATTTTDATSTT
jgi:GPH family glycoside/pentoside/hexuronide:cation symporter